MVVAWGRKEDVMATVDTGGVDLGPIGQLQGTLPGLNTITKTASRNLSGKNLVRSGRRSSSSRGKTTTISPSDFWPEAPTATPTYGPPGGWSGAAGELGGLL